MHIAGIGVTVQEFPLKLCNFAHMIARMNDADLLSPKEIERLAGERGMSLPELCRAAGISHTTFYRWKAGKTVPSIDIYKRICDALVQSAA
ncbi:MAG: helix-turn-helix transcriptional regulator [Bradyrhizobium sp.]|nr:helix-turn-helix transcriptional regulator [Bradyrhizobium sp.]